MGREGGEREAICGTAENPTPQRPAAAPLQGRPPGGAWPRSLTRREDRLRDSVGVRRSGGGNLLPSPTDNPRPSLSQGAWITSSHVQPVAWNWPRQPRGSRSRRGRRHQVSGPSALCRPRMIPFSELGADRLPLQAQSLAGKQPYALFRATSLEQSSQEPTEGSSMRITASPAQGSVRCSLTAVVIPHTELGQPHATRHPQSTRYAALNSTGYARLSHWPLLKKYI